MGSRERLLLVARTYERFSGSFSLARVGTLVRNDGKFFSRLISGGDCSTRAYDEVLQWFSERWPPREAWPKDVARPRKASPGQSAQDRAAAAPETVPANDGVELRA